ncbi:MULTISPECIES: hypothetical protein [Sphingomonas]|uniref:Uncharacterized protein n=2 Tax=Sphingomonas paucimobilis TaxID=13689 RepID=A0A7Y2KM58_SPHPI|nr:hypothetical protein [Sphingomonas paucimobilis]MCM3681444.1 hypothetical protein [Sphingomonas paucimobilis]NNG56519.1 hypothetical protein [Sphingomonas paucimobilis]
MNVRQAVGALAAIFLALIAVGSADAQTRSTRDTAMAYGARLTADAATVPVNRHRVNNRLSNRLDNRISLRIERYAPTVAADPGAAFTMSRDDGTHANPVDTGVGSLSQTRQRVPISGPGTFGAPENETSDISGQ